MRYSFDASVKRLDGGTRLLGGSPMKLLKLSEAGARFVDRLQAHDDLGRTSPGQDRLLERFLDAGIVHPDPDPALPRRCTAADVTVVIPTYGPFPASTVAALGAVGRIVVVDDCSPAAVRAAVEAGPSAPSVEVVRRSTNGGPAAARNTGLEHVRTPLVAFVDQDCVPSSSWLDVVLAHFDDDRVGLVAPRIVAADPGRSRIARYEAVRSPLDLGPRPARIRARTRVSYVPAAALVVRTEALRGIGGFDASLRVGEDVDMVWRLDEAGWRCRYEPAATVGHHHREQTRDWLRRRVDYGASAGPLAVRHEGALAPLGVSGWSAASWFLTAFGQPAAGALVAAATTALLAPKLDVDHPWQEAVDLAGRGHLGAGTQIADAVRRVWWPLAVVAAWRFPRARRALALAVVAPLLDEWRRTKPELDPVTWIALRVADDMAYGTGVWIGSARARTVAPLVPDLTSWPRPPKTDPRAERRRIPLRRSFTSPGR